MLTNLRIFMSKDKKWINVLNIYSKKKSKRESHKNWIEGLSLIKANVEI